VTTRLGTFPFRARGPKPASASASFSPSGDPLPSQRFSRKYLTRHKKSAKLWRRASRLTPGGVESNVRHFRPHPFLADYGDGGYIYDVDGNKILDFMMGFGALFLGHNNRDVALEVIKQLESGSMLGVTSELFIDYLSAVQKAVPSMRKMRLCNSGTEATMHAIRTARAYTGRDKIAKAEGAYHGAHDYVLQSLDMDARTARRNNGYKPVPYGKGIPKAVSDTVVIYPYNDIEGTAEALERSDDIAALIVEPVLCGPGVIVPKGNYLKRLRQLTRKRGIVLIFDEVLTGFRLAYGGAQEYYDVRPDMTTFGKIAGGGFQLAGFGGESQIMGMLDPGRGWRNATFHAGTYNGHPIAVAAGLKAVQILGEHPEYYDQVNRLGRQLFSGLQDLADDRRIPAWVEYVGSIGNVYFTTKDEIRNFRDTLSANTRRWWNWFIHCLGNNVLFGIPNTGERAFLCTEHTDEDVEWALEVADNAFAAIAKEAKRNREKVPSVQLHAAGEQAALYGEAVPRA
jgi:glutamate-1-semialdehyde 2,1-aminomutase